MRRPRCGPSCAVTAWVAPSSVGNTPVVPTSSASKRLAIELDGGQHYQPAGQAADALRDEYLATRRITVLRFGTDLIFREREGVIAAIAVALGVEL
jgi:very-short-patch-repair endonuclease